MALSTAIVMAIFAPLLGAALPALAARWLGPRVGWLALPLPILSTACLLVAAAQAGAQPSVAVAWAWVPSLQVDAAFLVDGLSLFFALVVSGIGLLIVLYAIAYFGRHGANQGRFFSYLMLFMAAMLGTVLADHLLLLFVFWELTGLASFLLIGFLHEEKPSRIGARQALVVTAGTGLALLAGAILLGQAAGTYRLSELLDGGLTPGLLRDPRVQAALVLLLLGGFGKSAQFPFFFWLPGAMAAPTPVSAYLHSATMVKLGVFLCARLFPLFATSAWWPVLLLATGFGTMLLGAVLALRQTDLKALLAYSTVSQLGFLCGYYGLGALTGVRFDLVHVLNHTLYKGALFMIAGAIDHAAHTRDLRRLGGLWRSMPLAAAASLLCLAGMAGVIGTTGFLSKELALADLLRATADRPVLYTALAAFLATGVANAMLAVRFFHGVFLGAPRSDGARAAHAPSVALLLPPLMLALGVLTLGLFPAPLADLAAHWSVAGLQRPEAGALHLWHGWTPELLLSTGVIAVGLMGGILGERAGLFGGGTPRLLRFDEGFEAGLKALGRGARAITRVLQTDRPSSYLPIVLATFVALVAGSLWRGGLLQALPGLLADLPHGHTEPLRVFVAGLICLAVLGVLALKQWTTQLVALSVAGFLTTFYFVIYRAPDLALTQILVEAVTLILILLLLGRFPRSAEQGERAHHPSPARRVMAGGLAACTGLVMTTLMLLMTAAPHPDRLGPRFLVETRPLAQGSNAVNTVLVDFRGFDTLFEITVLLVATLGCLGLLLRYKRTPAELREGAAGPAGYAEADKEAR